MNAIELATRFNRYDKTLTPAEISIAKDYLFALRMGKIDKEENLDAPDNFDGFRTGPIAKYKNSIPFTNGRRKAELEIANKVGRVQNVSQLTTHGKKVYTEGEYVVEELSPSDFSIWRAGVFLTRVTSLAYAKEYLKTHAKNNPGRSSGYE